MKANLLVSSVLAAGMMVLGQAHAQTTSPDGGLVNGPAANADHGQAVRTTTQGTFSSGADRETADEQSQPHPDNHGLEVSTTARNSELTGQAKGAAVSAVASEGRSAQRGKSSVGRAHRPERTARANRAGERSVSNRAIGRSSAAAGRRGRAH